MKNKFLFLSAALLLLAGCASTQNVAWSNVPKAGSDKALFGQRGALIMNPKASNVLNTMIGELLYIDSSGVISIERREGRIELFSPRQYGDYKLHALRPEVTTTGWSASTSPLLFIPHGLFGFATVPLSIVTSGLNLYAERRAYGMYLEDLPFEGIRAHCRFPMGIPEGYEPTVLAPKED